MTTIDIITPASIAGEYRKGAENMRRNGLDGSAAGRAAIARIEGKAHVIEQLISDADALRSAVEDLGGLSS